MDSFLCNTKNNTTHNYIEIGYNEYRSIQQNGQRIFSPPSEWSIPNPPKGSEVFVGNLPRDLDEYELLATFARISRIHTIRLMMDFSGENRGFAFIRFITPECATLAVLYYNKFQIRKGWRINVHISVDNHRLFLGNIPKYLSPNEVRRDLESLTDGLVDIIIYLDLKNPNLNRGFCFVEYDSHASAAIARRQLINGNVSLWDQEIRINIDWADPEPILDPMVLSQVTTLFMKNIPLSWTPRNLKFMIRRITIPINVLRVYKKDNYAFIHFATHFEAEYALQLLTSDISFTKVYDIEVDWARPPQYNKISRMNQIPRNFCLSVPPRKRKIIMNWKRENFNESKSESSSEEDLQQFTNTVLANKFQCLLENW